MENKKGIFSLNIINVDTLPEALQISDNRVIELVKIFAAEAEENAKKDQRGFRTSEVMKACIEQCKTFEEVAMICYSIGLDKGLSENRPTVIHIGLDITGDPGATNSDPIDELIRKSYDINGGTPE